MRTLLDKFFANAFVAYIRFVFFTSKITTVGDFTRLDPNHEEKFIIGFWHGENYCFYPLLKNTGFYVITTTSARGAAIQGICDFFGYKAIRLPDESNGQNFIFKLRQQISKTDPRTLAVALDGPQGPQYEPKKFVLLTALSTRRRLLPISVKVKRKIVATNRWDDYIVPLPFSHMEFTLHEPINVVNGSLDETAELIRREMGVA